MPTKLGVSDDLYDSLKLITQALGSDVAGGGGSGVFTLGNDIYLWHASGAAIEQFDPTEAGLIAAIAAATSGDTVWLPSINIAITAALVLKAGVLLCGIDTSATISRSANNSSDLTTLQGPASGTAYLSHLTILCTQSGSGGAVGLLGDAGQVYAHDSIVNGTSVSGSGYAVRSGNGVITLDDCWIVGSTAPLIGAGTGDAYVAGDEISSGAINVASETGELISGLTASNWYAVECYGGPFNANPADPHDAYDYQVSNDGGASWTSHLGFDGVAMFLTAPAWGVNPVDLDGLHARFFFQATTASIKIRVEDSPGGYGDNTGSLSWRLRSAVHNTSGIINVITHTVRMTTVEGEPAQGDRSVWDALSWAARHTNDVDVGIHHTLAALDARYSGGGAGGVDPVGWLAGWKYRIPYTVTNADGTYTNKKVPLDVNTLPLVEAALCKNDLSDLRVTSSDGVSLLPFFRANEALLFNETNFARYASNPIVTIGGVGTWDHTWVHPWSVVDNGAGTLYMYYGGDNGAGPGFPYQIGLATSTDGLTWTKHVGNPIVTVGAGGAWDSVAVSGFTAWKEGANWYALYSGYNGTLFKTGYATSSDGISWTKYGSNPVMSVGAGGQWDDTAAGVNTVILDGSTYKMWYWGATSISDQTTWQIGYATSPDRITWTKHASNPVLAHVVGTWEDGVLDCDVKKIGSTYFMVYQGNTADQLHSAIGLATSADGVIWTRAASNPFPKGGAGSWDEDWNEGPLLYRLGSEWLMYYMGAPVPGTGGPQQIGVMQFPDTRLWPIIPSLTSSGTTLYVYYGNATATDTSTGSAGSTDVNLTITPGTQGTPEFAAWDDETQPSAHARDISDATYTLHLNPALNANVGTFGDSTHIPQITVNARGLVSAVVNVPLSEPINVYNETATADGVNTTYYLANYAAPGTIRVYINGIRQPASDDTAPTDVVTFTSVPIAGALLMFDYEMDVL